MTEIAPNLVGEEVECRCGCGFAALTPGVVSLWTQIRERVGRPISVNSGCRCEAYNEHLRQLGYKAVRASRHLVGDALDMQTPMGMSVYDFAALCHDVVFRQGGLGIGRSFVHVDARYLDPDYPPLAETDAPARWQYT